MGKKGDSWLDEWTKQEIAIRTGFARILCFGTAQCEFGEVAFRQVYEASMRLFWGSRASNVEKLFSGDFLHSGQAMETFSVV